MSEIQEITLTNLFGYLNYHIPLNKTDNITIIHGPNGCGKTWILQLISYVFSLNFAAIRTAPFEKVEFTFRDGGCLTVSREPEEPKCIVDRHTKFLYIIFIIYSYEGQATH